MAGALLIPVAEVRHDLAFKCENTGSEYGYTVCLGMFRKEVWNKTSALEAFIRQRYPSEFTNRWVSYAGTGRNVFGRAVLYGHGRPALVHLKTEVLDAYTRDLSDDEKKKLYDFLRTASRQEAVANVKKISEAVLSKSENQ